MRFLNLLLFLVTFCIVVPASAQTPSEEVVFWDVQGPNAQPLISEISRALGEQDSRHVVGADDLRAKLQAKSLTIPGCFIGTEQCRSAFQLTTETLGLTSVVRVTTSPTETTYKWLDTRGTLVREGRATGDSKAVAYAMVRDIFDATGSVTITSKPSGADVVLAGEVIGKTPHTHRLPIGAYTFTVREAQSKTKTIDVDVTTASNSLHNIDLETVPGRLIVSDAPAGAEVFVNGNLVGKVGEPIELEPGNYTIDVRADGYDTVSDAIEVTSGMVVNKTVPLERTNFLLRDVSTEAIAHRKYILRLGYEHGFQRATFQDGTTSNGAEFLGLVDSSGGLPPNGRVTTALNTDGLRLDASYAFGDFGLVILSASYLVGSPDDVGLARIDGEEERVTLSSNERFQIRPFQLFYRRFYSNFVPTAELGIGVDFHWFEATRDNGDSIEFARSEAFWTLALGAQYYFTNSLFATARYSLQDYFTSGPGVDHQVSIGVGVSFSNLLGFDPEPPGTL